MIETLLPETAVAVDAFGDDLADSPLFPEEEQLIARSVEKRQRSFTAVRACARRALAKLGIPPAPILHGEHGCPTWPDGIVGSMTHCDGYCAAAVARSTEMTALGIDAEPHHPLPEGVLDVIAHPEELSHFADLRITTPQICWDRLLFSAKESTYKAWFPQTHCWLNFEEAVVTADPTARTFTARLLVPAPKRLGSLLQGRWTVRNGFVVTTIVAPEGGLVLWSKAHMKD
jgi:4'-phosphopantetheinyl transferase EntD